jgi:dTDP-4-dehydrorhamnose reductase
VKVVTLGGSGFFGPHLASAFWRAGGTVIETYFSNRVHGGRFFDLRHTQVADVLRGLAKPDVAVILAGITNIDACACDPIGTLDINVYGVVRVIDELRALDIIPVFISSDGVFDGSRGNWRESDRVSPILTYGRHKADVEFYLGTLPQPWLVIRLPKLLSMKPDPRCMLTVWLNALSRNQRIRCAIDQYYSPLATNEAAEAVVRLVKDNECGVWHRGAIC